VNRLISIVALLIATDASAQSVAVTAGLFHDSKRFSGDPELNVLDGDARGGHIAVGTMVFPRVLVTLEIGAGAESAVTRTTTVALPGRTVDIHTEYTNQLTAWSVLAGLRSAPIARLQLTYLGGVTFSHLVRHITPDAQSPIVQPAPPPTTSTTIDDVSGATAGIDVAVRVAPHVAAVFFTRAHAFRVSSDLAAFSIRPGVAAQLSF